jgi:hypothetical protein
MYEKIPEFNSYEKMAEFWNSHSLANYWDQTEPTEFEISNDVRRRYLVSVDRELFGRVQRMARARGLSTECLIKSLLEQCLRELEAQTLPLQA